MKGVRIRATVPRTAVPALSLSAEPPFSVSDSPLRSNVGIVHRTEFEAAGYDVDRYFLDEGAVRTPGPRGPARGTDTVAHLALLSEPAVRGPGATDGGTRPARAGRRPAARGVEHLYHLLQTERPVYVYAEYERSDQPVAQVTAMGVAAELEMVGEGFEDPTPRAAAGSRARASLRGKPMVIGRGSGVSERPGGSARREREEPVQVTEHESAPPRARGCRAATVTPRAVGPRRVPPRPRAAGDAPRGRPRRPRVRRGRARAAGPGTSNVSARRRAPRCGWVRYQVASHRLVGVFALRLPRKSPASTVGSRSTRESGVGPSEDARPVVN